MFQFLKKRSIRVQLVSFAVLTVVVMFGVTLYFSFQASALMERHNNQYENQLMFQITQSVSNRSQQISYLLSGLSRNNQVQKYMLETEPLPKYLDFKSVDKLFSSTITLTDGILDIVVQDGSGLHYFQGCESPYLDSVIRSLPGKAEGYFSKKISCPIKSAPTDCILAVSPVYSLESDTYMNNLGKVIIVLDARQLGLRLDRRAAADSGDFFLLDRSGQIYSDNDASAAMQALVRRYAGRSPGSYRVSYRRARYHLKVAALPDLSGKLVSVVSDPILQSGLNMLLRVTILVMLLATALLFIPFTRITDNILRPMRQFIGFINSVQSPENLQKEISLEGYREISIMSDAFNNLIHKISSLSAQLLDANTRLYESRLELKEAELNYLRSQINPHFLYNTLETIKGCAIDEHAPQTYAMAKALGRIFRYSVKGEPTVLLREELGVVQSYMQIQQTRFSDRITTDYACDEAALNCRIPKIILQPIVENAVVHGLEPKLGRGNLSIRAAVEKDGALQIRVEDDGVGMEQPELKRVRANLACGSDTGRSIGMCNVQRRIRLKYGDAYGLRIESEAGRGTAVTIRLPALPRKDEPRAAPHLFPSPERFSPKADGKLPPDIPR